MSILPTVSLCTPTFNRRPFFTMMTQCVLHQTYRHIVEWVIVDDGTDPIEDLVTAVAPEFPFPLRYVRVAEKMTLGRKRNFMHDQCSGDILVYVDDDDYYPPTRVAHSVETLLRHPEALCAGSSEMYIYFPDIEKMYRFGPYGPNHATAATFAFRRTLLEQTRYNDTFSVAEEKEFLKNYTVPFVQLDAKQTILVVSHNHNSFDKRTLLNRGDPRVNETTVTMEELIAQPDLLRFFREEMGPLLEAYAPGKPENKPDVLEHIDKLTKEREKMIEDMKRQRQVQVLKQFQEGYETKINQLVAEKAALQEHVDFLESKVTQLIQRQIATATATQGDKKN